MYIIDIIKEFTTLPTNFGILGELFVFMVSTYFKNPLNSLDITNSLI